MLLFYTELGSAISSRIFADKACSGQSKGDTYNVGDCVASVKGDGTYVTGTPVPASIFTFISSATPSSCFAGTETLMMESGEVKAIDSVRVGDRVLSADVLGRTSFAEVHYITVCIMCCVLML